MKRTATDEFGPVDMDNSDSESEGNGIDNKEMKQLKPWLQMMMEQLMNQQT